MFDSCLRNQFHHHKKKVAKKFRLRDTVVLLNKIRALIRLPSKSCSTENDSDLFLCCFSPSSSRFSVETHLEREWSWAEGSVCKSFESKCLFCKTVCTLVPSFTINQKHQVLVCDCEVYDVLNLIFTEPNVSSCNSSSDWGKWFQLKVYTVGSISKLKLLISLCLILLTYQSLSHCVQIKCSSPSD